jgi:excinuclease ABC subunit C
MTKGEILEQFLILFYKSNNLPKTVYLSEQMENQRLFEEAMKVKVVVPKTGDKLEFIKKGISDAKLYLDEKYLRNKEIISVIKQIKEEFGLKCSIKRIDVFDNSHLSKTNPVGAMIVFKEDKFSKADYRHYNLSSSTNGDDIKMMNETVFRRYQKHENLPSLILIDGGKTQLNAVVSVLKDLGLDIPVACIAKGDTRNSRDETIYLSNGKVIKYEKGNSVLLFLERLRDEVHRFAITFNKKKRMKSNFTSEIDGIEGIGAVRKKALMNHFGSVKGIKEANVKELMKVSGISKSVAEKIKNYFEPT